MVEPSFPIPGRDYPRNLVEFYERFGSEDDCIAFLLALRWPDGFECPLCNGTHSWRKTRGRLECRRCHHESSVTAGTLFQKTRKPIRLWFFAMWWVTSQKYGANALGLQRVLGLGSYQTAWTWLHKLRRAMVRPGRDRLSGLVEIDETYVGGEEAGVRGRKTRKKAIVAIAVEVLSPKGFGRIRMRRIPDVSAASLTPFVRETVEPGSTVHTDGWKGYNDISKCGYTRVKTILSASDEPAHVSMPAVHRVSSLLKRWLLGTHQGAVRNRHLDYYLDEFTFRFNRRSSRHRGMLFFRLMQQAVQVGPTTYGEIVGGQEEQP